MGMPSPSCTCFLVSLILVQEGSLDLGPNRMGVVRYVATGDIRVETIKPLLCRVPVCPL